MAILHFVDTTQTNNVVLTELISFFIIFTKLEIQPRFQSFVTINKDP